MLRWRVLVACLALGSFTTGCSFLFVQTPTAEARRSGQPLPCTTSTLAPGLDGAFTSLNVLSTLVAVTNSDEDYRDAAFSRSAAIASGLLWAAVGLSSAIYGFNATSECREALGMETSRTRRTRPHSRDVAAEIAEEEAAQARAAARAAEQARAAGQAAQESMPAAGRTDAGAPR